MAKVTEETKKRSRSDRIDSGGGNAEHMVKEQNTQKKHRADASEPISWLLADEQAVDPALSSLFAHKPSSIVQRPKARRHVQSGTIKQFAAEDQSESQLDANKDRSTLKSYHDTNASEVNGNIAAVPGGAHVEPPVRPRKRKREEVEDELEDAYMRRLARDEDIEAEEAAEVARARKLQRLSGRSTAPGLEDLAEQAPTADDFHSHSNEEMDKLGVTEEDEMDAGRADRAPRSQPPPHETLQAADIDLSKANRTVFLGNVSIAAISSKSARKELVQHLSSFFSPASTLKDGDPKHRVESLRFRSTAYTGVIPKKAAFARKELMDATTKSTNAYAVYSSDLLACEAVKVLNGTVILGRHLRVDRVAHPAAVDHKRCVFIGNLGFVDDESNIQEANEEDGREKRKRGKEPADVEEGLWRTFGRCGRVDSVRVIRDTKTRVGKGIAYVQFEDGNAVEAALLLDGKKFPPMLPRKLRVQRAKARRRNPQSSLDKPSLEERTAAYQRKTSAPDAPRQRKMGNLFGRAAAAQMGRTGRLGRASGGERLGNGVGGPDSFVFEGHRASSKSGNSGLRLGRHLRKGKPRSRSARRGAAFKAAKKAAQ